MDAPEAAIMVVRGSPANVCAWNEIQTLEAPATTVG